MINTFESKYLHPLKDVTAILNNFKLPTRSQLQQQDLTLIKQLKVQINEILSQYNNLQQNLSLVEADLWESHVNAIYATFQQSEQIPVFDKNCFVTLTELNELINQAKKPEITETLQNNTIVNCLDKLKEIVRASNSFLDDLQNVSTNIKTNNFSTFVSKIFRNVNLEDEINLIFKIPYKTHKYDTNGRSSKMFSPSRDDSRTHTFRIGASQRGGDSGRGKKGQKVDSSNKKNNSVSNSDASSVHEDIDSETENKLWSKDQCLKELMSGYNSQVKVPKNSKFRIDLRKSMMAWGKDKKIFEGSVRQINRFINIYEKEAHSRFKTKKDTYCREMALLWEILETSYKDREYAKAIKACINNDADFALKILDNVHDHQNFVKYNPIASGQTDELMQKHKNIISQIPSQTNLLKHLQSNNANNPDIQQTNTLTKSISKDPYLDVNIFGGVIKIKIKVCLYLVCENQLYKYLANEQIGDTIITRKHLKVEDFEKYVNLTNDETCIVGWIERVKKGSKDLESVFNLMNDENLIITLRITPDIKLYLLTQKQAKELSFLGGKQFYCNSESLGNCFFIIGFVQDSLITEYNLFIKTNEFQLYDLIQLNNENQVDLGKRTSQYDLIEEPQPYKRPIQTINQKREEDDDADDKSSISSFSSKE